MCQLSCLWCCLKLVLGVECDSGHETAGQTRTFLPISINDYYDVKKVFNIHFLFLSKEELTTPLQELKCILVSCLVSHTTPYTCNHRITVYAKTIDQTIFLLKSGVT